MWAEDAKPTAARTLPPRHAEAAAMALYQRVARRAQPPRPRTRIGWTSLTFAAILFLLAVAVFPVDLPLLHTVSGALALAGFVFAVKGVLGY